MSQIDIEQYRSQLNEIFKARGVTLAYLFGSQATGKAGPLSDVDIAALLESTQTSAARYDTHLLLIGDLMGVLHSNEIDVVILNDAPPLLAFNIVRHGKVIYCPLASARVNYAVHALQQYIDTKPLRQLQRRALIADVTRWRESFPDAKTAGGIQW